MQNNVIQSFVKLEQLLTTNGYSPDDMIITSCPSAEQISILLSSASILAADAIVNFSVSQRKVSTSLSEVACLPQNSSAAVQTRKYSLDKKVCFEGQMSQATMDNLPEMSESSGKNSRMTSPTALLPEPPQDVNILVNNDIDKPVDITKV